MSERDGLAPEPVGELVYDEVAPVTVLGSTAEAEAASTGGEGLGCHAGAEQLRARAIAAGNRELLERYARDLSLIHI